MTSAGEVGEDPGERAATGGRMAPAEWAAPGPAQPDALPVVVIGAGPAGLAAAYELARLKLPALVFERDQVVGGLARTVEHRAYRFDIGGHRFFTKSRLVAEMWREILGDELLERPRLSRIYYRQRFFDYPLKPWRALATLGPWEAMRIAASYIRAQLLPSPVEQSFEQWIVNRFGRRLYEVFFKTYTEKVWGIPCSQIDAAWAAQRIKSLDLWKAVRSALPGGRQRAGEEITTLIERFHYPRLGPGQMWQRCSELAGAGGAPTATGARAVGVHLGNGSTAVTIRHHDGREERVAASHVISSMPIGELLALLDPPPPPAVLAAGGRLRYRDFLTVVLVVRRAEMFPDNWIYVHAPEVRVGRVQNFKNWSADMVPDPATTSLGCEYFLSERDALWQSPDAELVAFASRELAAIGLLDPAEVAGGAVVRMPKAYPVYDDTYRAALAEIRAYLATIPNLHLVGRNGQHRYNNQDHSMLTGIFAARNIAGAAYDLWQVNADAEYHEEETPAADRRTPEPIAGEDLDALLSTAFARIDPLALGGATGIVAAATLALLSAWLSWRGGEAGGPTLSLLGQYLLGYGPRWPAALVGVLEAALAGALWGWMAAGAVNLLIGWHETDALRRLRLLEAWDATEGGEPDRIGSRSSLEGDLPARHPARSDRPARPSGRRSPEVSP